MWFWLPIILLVILVPFAFIGFVELFRPPRP